MRNRKIHQRRGITLLFVVSMIVLFLLMGTTFVVVSNNLPPRLPQTGPHRYPHHRQFGQSGSGVLRHCAGALAGESDLPPAWP